MLSKVFLWSAAILSLAGLLAHEFAGTPMVLPPLSTTDLPADVIWLHHFSWHVGSIAVAGMIALFVYTAVNEADPVMAVVASAMSLGFAMLGVSLAIWGDNAMWGTPAPYAWWPITILGGLGAWTSQRTR